MNSSCNSALFSVPAPLLFHITGRDASRYLHARLSNNIRDLAPMRGCAAAALNPQGRTEVFGIALKFSAEEFYFVCDGGNHAEVMAALLRYKVADRLDCTLLSEYSLIHVEPAEALSTSAPQFAPLSQCSEFSPIKDGGIVAYKHKRSPMSGIDLFGPSAEIEVLKKQLLDSGANLRDESACLADRIKARRPSFPAELNDQGIFLESGLSHAVSFTKGCYVGQEVLEKVDSHGRLPYSIVSLSSVAPAQIPSPESAITTRDGILAGEVLRAAQDTETGLTLCFARIKTSTMQPEGSFAIHNQEYRLL